MKALFGIIILEALAICDIVDGQTPVINSSCAVAPGIGRLTCSDMFPSNMIWNGPNGRVSVNDAVEPGLHPDISVLCNPFGSTNPTDCTISFPTLRDVSNGTWQCVTVGTTDATVSVLDQADIDQEAGTISWLEDVYINCSTPCLFPHATIEWSTTKNNYNLTSGTKTTTCADRTQAYTTSSIRVTQYLIGHNLTCTAFQNDICLDEVERTFTIKEVRGNVSVTQNDCMLSSESRLSLVCNSSGMGKMTWKRDGSLVSANTEIYYPFNGTITVVCNEVVSPFSNPTQCNMSLPADRQYADGTWTCSELDDEEYTIISVFDQVEISTIDIDETTLKCITSCVHPPAVISWHPLDNPTLIPSNYTVQTCPDGLTSVTESLLPLTSVTSGDTYVCTANQSHHCLTSTSVSIEVFPSEGCFDQGWCIAVISVSAVAGVGLAAGGSYVIYKSVSKPSKDDLEYTENPPYTVDQPYTEYAPWDYDDENIQSL